MTEQRLPRVDQDDGTWGDILLLYLTQEHYNVDSDNAANGGHQFVTIRPGVSGAGGAPLTFDGTGAALLSTPVAGAMEFQSNVLYFTPNTTRDTVVLADATQTLAAKTLTAPKFADLGFIADANGNEMLRFDTVTGAVNYLDIINAATGAGPEIVAKGDDTNIDLNLAAKAGGVVKAWDAGAQVYREVATISGTQTLTNKTIDGYSRLVCSTVQGGTGTEDGANTWAKIATFSTGTDQFVDCTLVLTVTNEATGALDSAIVSVFFRSNSTSTNPTVDVSIIAQGGVGTHIGTDSFKVISGAWSTDMELWVKKTAQYGGFNVYETSRNDTGFGTLTYTTNPAWQSSTPSGAVNNVSSNGVEANGVPVVTISGTQTLTNKTLTDPKIATIKDANGNTSLYLPAIASAVNYIEIGNSATGNAPYIYANGSDTNISLSLYSKGTGDIYLFNESGDIIFQADNTSASAVNYAYVSNAITGNPAIMGSWGSDTDVDLALDAKGAGLVKANQDGTNREVATISGTQTLTNKTLSGASNTITNLGVNLTGTFASLPAAGTIGRMYYCTDIDLILYDNGSSWDRAGGGSRGPTFTAPPTSSWSTTTLGSSTVAADKDGRLFTIVSAAGTNARVEYRTLSPTSNYTATAYIETNAYGGDYCGSGIWLRESGTSELIRFGMDYSSANGGFTLIIDKWNSPTSYNSLYAVFSVWEWLSNGIPNWLRIRDDGTDRHYEFSYNGIDWVDGMTTTRTNFLTPDGIGWGGYNNAGNGNVLVRLRSWTVA